MVETTGFGPVTFCSRSKRATKLRYVSMLWCTRRDSNPHGRGHTPLKRTCLPIPPLVLLDNGSRTWNWTKLIRVWTELDPRLYGHIVMAEEEGFEPSLAFTTTNGLANRPLQPLGYSSRAVWICCKRRDSNPRRPPACKAGALPTELRPQHLYYNRYSTYGQAFRLNY